MATSPATPYALQIQLDRTSPVPLYYQISEPIAKLILDGDLPAGTRLEDELSMAARLQVSRPTARQALQRLVDRGLLTRRRGVGTIVAPTHVHRPMELTSLLNDLKAAGHTVHTSVSDYEEHPANAEEAKLLKVRPGTALVHIVRLRYADDEPVSILDNLLPADIAPSMRRLEDNSLYDLFRELDIVPTTAHQVIGARLASVKEATMLNERRNAAVLTAQRTTYDANGRVIEYGNHIYRASRYSFETTLFSQ